MCCCAGNISGFFHLKIKINSLLIIKYSYSVIKSFHAYHIANYLQFLYYFLFLFQTSTRIFFIAGTLELEAESQVRCLLIN